MGINSMKTKRSSFSRRDMPENEWGPGEWNKVNGGWCYEDQVFHRIMKYEPLLTWQRFHALIAAGCVLCVGPLPNMTRKEGVPHVHHNYEKKKFIGLTCGRCNIIEGHLPIDNTEAVAYLRRLADNYEAHPELRGHHGTQA